MGSGLPLLLSSALCFFFSFFSFLCFLFPCRTQRTRKDQCRQGQYEGQRARCPKHIGRFRQAPRTDTKTTPRKPRTCKTFTFSGSSGKKPELMQHGLVDPDGHGVLQRGTGGREGVQ